MFDSEMEQRIAIVGPVDEGQTQVFTFTDVTGLTSEGLVTRFQGELRAFKNMCRHQPLPLDYGDGEFYSEDGKFLFCRNHAAFFEPDTGLCVAGPCMGASLFQYPVAEANGEITVTIPPQVIELE